MQRLVISALIVALGLPFAQAFTVYKTIGEHGEVRYTQAPPQNVDNIEVLEFRDDGRVNTAGQMAPQDNSAELAQQSQNAEVQRQIEEQQARDQAERCRTLRNNLANLNIGGSVFERGPDGQTRYLSAQEIEERRQRTQQTIEQFCQ